MVLEGVYYNNVAVTSAKTARVDIDDDDDVDDDDSDDHPQLTIDEQNFLAAFDSSGSLALKYATAHHPIINSTSSSVNVSSLNNSGGSSALKNNGSLSLQQNHQPLQQASALNSSHAFANTITRNSNNNNNNNGGGSSALSMTLFSLPSQAAGGAAGGAAAGGGGGAGSGGTSGPGSPTSSLPPNLPVGTPQGSAIAVLTCRPNSHPFQVHASMLRS